VKHEENLTMPTLEVHHFHGEIRENGSLEKKQQREKNISYSLNELKLVTM
jgi:hypothetical protein